MLNDYTKHIPLCQAVFIKILNFFNNPEKFDNLNVNSYVMGSPLQPLSKVYPEVVPLKDKCINDLYNDGLMTTQSINVTMTVQGMLAKRTTELGDEFLSFLKLI